MAYRGQTYSIDCSRGGLTGCPNIEAIDATMMVSGTKNVNLHDGGRQKRGGTQHVNAISYAGPELMPNVADRELSAPSAWANVDLSYYDETGDLSLTATAAAQYCTLPVASAPTTSGLSYRLSFNVTNRVSTWTIKSYDGSQTVGTVTANGANAIEFTALTTGGLRIVAASDTSSGDFSNFSLKRISEQVMGVFDFTQSSGDQFVMTYIGGRLYKNLTEAVITGLNAAVTTFPSFAIIADKLFMANGVDSLQVWDGEEVTGGVVDHSPSDWMVLKPFQVVKHGRFNAQQMWAITPLGIYGSNPADYEDFSDANVTVIYIDTQDGYGLQGGTELGDRLIIMGKTQTYILEDTDSDPTTWAYSVAPWRGGVAHKRLIIPIPPNDVVCMAEDLEIYSVAGAQSIGDYEMASLTRESWMHTWIKENVDGAYVAKFHGTFDPVQRAIYIWVVRSGQTTPDTALKYYIDRGPKEGWTLCDNRTAASGYAASVSTLVRKSAGSYKVYTGDHAGFVWELEHATKSDNGNDYYAGFYTPILSLENPRAAKMFHRLKVIMKKTGAYNLSVNWWVDGVKQTAGTLSMNGSYTWVDPAMQLGKIGKRIQFEFYNSTKAQDFFIDRLLIDYKGLVSRQEAV